MQFRFRYAAVLVAGLLAGCFKTPKPECSFVCGPNSACPADYACAADNYCHLRLPNNELGACTFADARKTDAAIDATLVDGAIDGRPDAMVDAAPVCPALTPATDGSSRQDLVISEIRPGTFIELYNNTAAPITFSTTTFGLQSDAMTYELNAEAGAIAAHAYKTITWPAVFTASNNDQNGELGLFQNITAPTEYTVDANLIDYVCWGGNTPAHLAFAQGATKWTGNCTDELAASSLKRLASKDGLTKDSYDATGAPDPRNCTVP
ncbi:MAG TPA: hypothetical protein PLF40_16845 [Kofleriaceae bacterium]|nr:hypothetical protein [Kofleriaceae bacterium]